MLNHLTKVISVCPYMHNKSQKIGLKFNSTPSCLTRNEFPNFYKLLFCWKFSCTVQLKYRHTQGCGNRDFNNHNITTQFSQLEIFGSVRWSIWFFSLILAGRDIMMKKPWTLSEINHKVQKNLLNTTEKLPLMFLFSFLITDSLLPWRTIPFFH